MRSRRVPSDGSELPGNAAVDVMQMLLVLERTRVVALDNEHMAPFVESLERSIRRLLEARRAKLEAAQSRDLHACAGRAVHSLTCAS